jgi:hypothetical protein
MSGGNGPASSYARLAFVSHAATRAPERQMARHADLRVEIRLHRHVEPRGGRLSRSWPKPGGPSPLCGVAAAALRQVVQEGVAHCRPWLRMGIPPNDAGRAPIDFSQPLLILVRWRAGTRLPATFAAPASILTRDGIPHSVFTDRIDPRGDEATASRAARLLASFTFARQLARPRCVSGGAHLAARVSSRRGLVRGVLDRGVERQWSSRASALLHGSAVRIVRVPRGRPVGRRRTRGTSRGDCSHRARNATRRPTSVSQRSGALPEANGFPIG